METQKIKTEIRICVTGGRDYDKPELVEWVIYHLKLALPNRDYDVTLIHGNAEGADTFAKEVAWSDFHGGTIGMAWKTKPYPIEKENWKQYGKQAGPRRNRIMLTEGKPHVLISFPGGKGTADCIRTAGELGIPVISFFDAPKLTLFAKIDQCVSSIFENSQKTS
jgi:hypothetical protein